MLNRLIIATLFISLMLGCVFPNGPGKREFEYGPDGEKLYIGRGAGTGDTFAEAQDQALLLAASKAVGVKVTRLTVS